jgi:hypothetical protein
MSKKYFFVSLLILFGLFYNSCSRIGIGPVAPTPETTISVSSPKNGDTLMVASSFTVKWTSNKHPMLKLNSP